MKTYYKKRAPVYDAVYAYPERQEDLRYLEKYIPDQFTGLKVLEIAAGTGYWTQFIALVAESVLATDATTETLEQLKKRALPDSVSTRQADAYHLEDIPGIFSGAFAGLWLSHVPRQKYREFILGLHSKLTPGAIVVLIDNSKAQCNRLPITHEDEFGNTYQNRALQNGQIYSVLKNFPTQQELHEMTVDISSDLQFEELDNFWLYRYSVKKQPGT
ncbi:MAG: methyltransferase domain-containing protein [Halieaceae bacterium]|nr:methyltransferase domain-containing protein [Halieaceae bacterium]